MGLDIPPQRQPFGPSLVPCLADCHAPLQRSWGVCRKRVQVQKQMLGRVCQPVVGGKKDDGRGRERGRGRGRGRGTTCGGRTDHMRGDFHFPYSVRCCCRRLLCLPHMLRLSNCRPPNAIDCRTNLRDGPCAIAWVGPGCRCVLAPDSSSETKGARFDAHPAGIPWPIVLLSTGASLDSSVSNLLSRHAAVVNDWTSSYSSYCLR